MPYLIVDLEQGSPEWLEWRSMGIGASDAPAIMGENPWKTRLQLLIEKVEGRSTQTTPAMERGTMLEPEARARYEQLYDVDVDPICLQSRELPWFRASLDGLSADGRRVIEIKCGEGVYRRTAESGQVPRYYYGQLQHILAITGLQQIDFFCYLPDREELCLRVERDDGYIAQLLETEYTFWLEVEELRRKNARKD